MLSGTLEAAALQARLAVLEAENIALRAMREGDLLYRATFDQAAIGVAHLALDGRWLRVNTRFCAMLGYTEHELLGYGFRSVTHPDDLEADFRSIASLLAGEIASCHREKRYLSKNGGVLWVNLTVSLIRNADGTPRYFISIIEDISARKSVEFALADTDARLRHQLRLTEAITNNAAVALFIIDANQQCIFMNPAAETLTGYTLHELSGRALHAMLHHTRPDGSPYPLEDCPIDRAFPDRMRVRGEEVFVHRDGHFYDVAFTASPICEEGRPVGTVIEVQDITERKHAESALRTSRESLTAALAASDTGTFRWNPHTGEFLEFDSNLRNLFGLTADDPASITADFVACVHPEDRAPLMAAISACRSGADFSMEYRVVLPDGGIRWLYDRARMQHDSHGNPTYLVGACTDITKRKHAEDALRQLNDRLEARVREEVAAREAVQISLAQAEKMTALGQLAGGIAHDFNNILQTVAGGAGLILRQPGNPVAVKRLAGLVEDAARRGTSVTRRLLTFARRGELSAEAVDLAALLDDLGEVFAHTLGPDISIRVEHEDKLPPVLADRGQLGTVLLNLATNARDAMPEGGTLVLSATLEQVSTRPHPEGLAPGAYVNLAATDTGTGMDAATLARVMEPFFTTKKAGKGTGLGLPMARGFAGQSGGALAVNSTPGGGTTVRLWLPVAKTVAAEAQEPKPERPPPTGAAAPRILLVDDEEPVREIITRQLVDRGYNVVQADGGATALALLDAGDPVDLLVSDLSMPGMNGVRLIQEAQRRRPVLPAILLTGYAGDAAALAISREVKGTFTLLRKPVSGVQLVDSVAMLLETVAA